MDESAIDDLIAAYRLHCSENGLRVLPGDRVGEDVAAQLLDVSAKTLRNWRSLRTGPQFIKRPNRRVSYRLDAIAQWELADE